MKSIYQLVHFAETGSTNRKMQEDLQAGKNILNHVYYTDYQTAGKGIDSNIWHSEAKKNLLLSLAVKPENLEPVHQFMLTKAISLAVVDAVSLYVDVEKLSIKWPNDIYYDNSKLAGILISNTINANQIELSIIGIGLNVNQLKFPEKVPNPVSISQITAKQYDLEDVLNKLLLAVNDRLIQLKEADLHHFISFEYLSRMNRLEVWENYRYQGKIIRARILGVNNYGQLHLEPEHGEIIFCDFKEVEFILPI
jgi:BirA family biotin operon repressor/biotin-[acetyl-CoA-carboxylase] ligase